MIDRVRVTRLRNCIIRVVYPKRRVYEDATGSSLANGQDEKRSGRIQKSGKVGVQSSNSTREELVFINFLFRLTTITEPWHVVRRSGDHDSRSCSSCHCNKAVFRQFSSQISSTFVGCSRGNLPL